MSEYQLSCCGVGLLSPHADESRRPDAASSLTALGELLWPWLPRPELGLSEDDELSSDSSSSWIPSSDPSSCDPSPSLHDPAPSSSGKGPSSQACSSQGSSCYY